METNFINASMVRSIIPVRNPDSNKGDYGRILIVSGSNGMTGSGCLCANAALLSGAGLVYLAVPEELSNIYCIKLTESIIINIPSINGYMTYKGLRVLQSSAKDKDVIVLGPGLGRNFTTGRLVEEFVMSCTKPMIIDADGLNLLKDSIALKKRKSQVIITPHPGEMSRLCGITVEEVQNNRIEVATKFAKEYNVIVVLKGSGTIIAGPDGRTFINTTGNAGMATAGTGDVLAGLIGSLLGQEMDSMNACIAGVYIHGAAGDLVALKKGQQGVIAGDVAEAIPYSIKNLAEVKFLESQKEEK